MEFKARIDELEKQLREGQLPSPVSLPTSDLVEFMRLARLGIEHEKNAADLAHQKQENLQNEVEKKSPKSAPVMTVQGEREMGNRK